MLIIERDLTPPDTFRGELLQPGGLKKITELGLGSKIIIKTLKLLKLFHDINLDSLLFLVGLMAGCVEGIDGYSCYGYVVYESGAKRHIPIDFPQIKEESADAGDHDDGHDDNDQPTEKPLKKTRGISFHHGRFVGKLREFLKTVDKLVFTFFSLF